MAFLYSTISWRFFWKLYASADPNDQLSDNEFNDTTDGVIEVTNISYSTFKSIMDFIYTGRRPLQIDEAYDIFPATNLYDL